MSVRVVQVSCQLSPGDPDTVIDARRLMRADVTNGMRTRRPFVTRENPIL